MGVHAVHSVAALLSDLTAPQRQAVTHTEGPLLILAGPGSGKTRVVTRRAAHLAATVTGPRHILAITFTNKAAEEMKERIAALGVAAGMTVGTFHAFCARLLRRFAGPCGIGANFTIFDRADRLAVIRQAIAECGLSAENFTPASMDQDISFAKNKLLSPADFADSGTDWRTRSAARVYEAYERILGQSNALDFDDLLMRTARLLSSREDVRAQLEDEYRYVLIDEYQDTNAAQYAIARLLTRARKNLCATGDPDQSIYAWRGADIGNILSFERDYPGAVVVRLEQNYRSTKRILAAADALIAGNVERKSKSLWTENETGSPIRVETFEKGEEEADGVARAIASDIRAGRSPNEIAVFYRVNALSRAVEEAMMRHGVAYQIARGVEFYNRKEVKDALAYLRVLVNPADSVSLLRIINVPPRGIGDATVERLKDGAREQNKTIHEVLGSAEAVSALGRSAGNVRVFAALLAELQAALSMSAPDAIRHVLRHSGLQALYGGEERGATLNATTSTSWSRGGGVPRFPPEAKLQDWLEHAALVSDVDSVDESGGKVTLMTLHAAKGLEFATVYVIALEDGLLPFRRGAEEEYGFRGPIDEEERRLCFVGMTRAKKRLTLSHARYRMLRGMTRRTVRSPFLDELPRGAVESAEAASPSALDPGGMDRIRSDRGRRPDDFRAWSVGTLVRHPLHGLGRILSIDRGPKRTHVDVQFRDGSERTWVLEFADLQRVPHDEFEEEPFRDED